MKPISLPAVVAALDLELRNDAFAADSSHNGLQVENAGSVRKACCGVDASLEFLERAVVAGADLCIVHHGLSWGSSLARITGTNHRLLSFLLRNNMALYASHLPLDAHPTLGNNAGLAKALGLRSVTPFGLYHGLMIGFRGRLSRGLSIKAFSELVSKAAPGGQLMAMPFGKPIIRTVGVVSGGAADELPQAVEAGLDAYVSGEGGLQAYNAARHGAINAFFAGHYATETFGVRALGRFVTEHFGIPAEFIDFRLPY